jgi:hypothetical protein
MRREAGIELEAAISTTMSACCGAQRPHHRLDAREQLARRERLDEIVVDAGLEARDLVDSQSAPVSMMIGTEAVRVSERMRRAKVRPGVSGSIQSSSIIWAASCWSSASAWRTVARLEDPVARVLQVQGEDFLELGIVFDDEDWCCPWRGSLS